MAILMHKIAIITKLNIDGSATSVFFLVRFFSIDRSSPSVENNIFIQIGNK